MTSRAVGIHAHDRYKTGLRPPKNAPALMLADILTGVVPAHGVAANHFGSVVFGLDENDKFGICGPTSCDNFCRLVSAALLGKSIAWTQAQVFGLYTLVNPTFNPVTGAGDNGVDMQTMLEKWVASGAGQDENGQPIMPIAFAKINVSNDDELDAAVAIFGAILWGVNLEVAQQTQSDAKPPKWDYKNSAEWGGHAVMNGKFDESAGDAEVISWEMDVATTTAFRRKQLQEAWAVILPWHIVHPAFQAGVDLAALQSAYTALTGKVLPIPAPSPAPAPTPAGNADQALWDAVGAWAGGHHTGTTKPVAVALEAWASAKGFSA